MYKQMNDIIEISTQGTGDSDRHALTLFAIAIGSKGKTIIELGVRNGNTTLPLLRAAKINKGLLYSVDIKDTNFIPEKDHAENWRFYQQDSIKFLENWNPKNDIDIIFLDDWHSYEHVKEQLTILDSIVSPSTVILLHDLMYGETCPVYHTELGIKDGQWGNGGPYRAVAELNPQFWEYATLPWNNGLTILRKKYSSKYKNK